MDNPTQNLYREEANQVAEAKEKPEEKQPEPMVRVSKETHEYLKDEAKREQRSIKATTDKIVMESFTKGQNRASKQYQINKFGELI